jgi:alpha-ketoglutarate-dependent taurine dioxygenase
LRIDPAYMSAVTEDSDAARALAEVSALIGGALTEVSIRPGEVLLLDNYRAVHGRRPFEARYDGRDRWLKRVNVTRDMRRQRSAGAEPTGVLV